VFRVGCKDPPTACRSRPNEAEGSLTPEARGSGRSSPDNDGTDWHYQTVRVRQARQEGVRR
jgi:hypothetical protein